MNTTGEWENCFVWFVEIDGVTYWFRKVQRRSVSVPIYIGLGEPEEKKVWEYRLRDDDPLFKTASTESDAQ